MKIATTKDHVLGKAGSVVEVDKDKGNYLIRCGVAKEIKDITETKEEKVVYETKESKPKKKRKYTRKNKGDK